MTSPWIDHWEKLERLIGQVIERTSEALPESDLAQVREFNENREYRLALEELIYIYSETGIRPTDDVRSMMTNIAAEMRMDAAISKLPR
jgi:hypothetical protein